MNLIQREQEDIAVALRTGISIIAGSSAVFALGFVLSYWRSRKGRLATSDASRNSETKTTRQHGGTRRTRGGAVVPVRVLPAAYERNALLEVDGGVSARPTEQWHDGVTAYDAAYPDDLGAEFLSRAVQVPRDVEDFSSDLDASGLHVDHLGEDDLPGEVLPASWGFRDDDIDELSTSRSEDDEPDEVALAEEEELLLAREAASKDDEWYTALREPNSRARRV